MKNEPLVQAFDFRGNEIRIGDTVIVPHHKYAELYRGVVLKVNPQQCSILVKNYWNYEPETQVRRFHKTLIVEDSLSS